MCLSAYLASYILRRHSYNYNKK